MSLLQAEKEAVSRKKVAFSIVAYPNRESDPAVDLIKDLLSLGHRVRFCAKGTSMHPTIRESEVITVCPVKPSDVRLRDIILYQNNSSLIAHRVVRIGRSRKNAPFLITRGDGLGSCDSPAESHQVLGKVISVDRNGRSIRLDNRSSKVFCTVRLIVLFLKRKMYRGVKAMRFVNTGKP